MPTPDQDQLDYHVLFAVTRLGIMVCLAVKAFRMGIETGMAAATSTSGGYHEETILRISDALDRVM